MELIKAKLYHISLPDNVAGGVMAGNIVSLLGGKIVVELEDNQELLQLEIVDKALTML